MIRIQEEWKIKLIPQTLYLGCDLADSHKTPLTLGGANDHWHINVPRGTEHCFQQNEVRDVEMADCDTHLIRVESQLVHDAARGSDLTFGNAAVSLGNVAHDPE